MKKILLAASAAAFMFAACNKDDDNDTTPSNTWTVNGTTYTATSVTGAPSANNLSAIDAGGNAITAQFTSMPTNNGTYKVVAAADLDASDEVSLTALLSSNAASYNTMTKGITADVKVDGTKVTITVPKVWAMKLLSTTDSVEVSANLTQTN